MVGLLGGGGDRLEVGDRRVEDEGGLIVVVGRIVVRGIRGLVLRMGLEGVVGMLGRRIGDRLFC